MRFARSHIYIHTHTRTHAHTHTHTHMLRQEKRNIYICNTFYSDIVIVITVQMHHYLCESVIKGKRVSIKINSKFPSYIKPFIMNLAQLIIDYIIALIALYII